MADDSGAKRNRVFLVHGRNKKARDAMFDFLRALGLQPIEWNQAAGSVEDGTPFIDEILDAGFAQAGAVVVLLTGDDEARLRQEFRIAEDRHSERHLQPQVRQNVLFEAGLAFATHPGRTVVCQVGEVRPFSDIFRRHLIRLNNSAQRRHEFAQRLQAAGCVVDTTGIDWQTAGDFDNAVAETSSRRGWLLWVGIVASLAALAVLLIVMSRGDDWRSAPDYKREFDANVSGGMYPRVVEGRLRNGREEFRADWRLPTTACWFASGHLFTKEDFEKDDVQHRAQGHTATSVRHFRDSAGVERYQVVWVDAKQPCE